MIYAIWKDVEDRNVNGVKDLVGYFSGPYQEADALVERMNKEDEGVAKQVEYTGHVRYGYWKEELNRLTAENFKEFIDA